MQAFRNMWFLVGCLAFLAAANISVYHAILVPRVLTVTVLAVGPVDKQNRTTLLHSPRGETLLIDTGPDASILRALGTALPMWQREIDAVILTSSAARSAGGLPTVQSRYRISKIIHIGDATTPYGYSLVFDTSIIKILAPSIYSISSGSSVFKISSSTPPGVYISDGHTIAR
ncbi:MAG: hypothetical protein Q7R59_02600 [bacterium]|nr:hypothetical protein [bacterium]